jgi:hypothetical protein
MPTMQDSVSVAANSVSANVLAGQLYEFLEAGTQVTLAVIGGATGIRTTYICGVPLINDQAIRFRAAADFPLIPRWVCKYTVFLHIAAPHLCIHELTMRTESHSLSPARLHNSRADGT